MTPSANAQQLDLSGTEKPTADAVIVRRRGPNLVFRTNGLIAALKLQQWQQAHAEDLANGITAAHVAQDPTILGIEQEGLKMSLDIELAAFLKTRRAFLKHETATVKEIPKLYPVEYRRNLEKLKALDLWDKLFPFQRHDAAIHAIKHYSYLGYDMRMGKTRTAIAATILKGTKSNLIVCRSRLIRVWRIEMQKMGIDPSDIQIVRHVSDMDCLKTWNITSFEAIRQRPACLYRRMRRRFTCIIMDESQAAKNRDSQQGQAARSLKARHKMLLTGTIAENYITEAYWQLHWLLGAPNIRFPYPYIGGMQRFREQFCEFGQSDSGRAKVLPKIKNAELFWALMDTVMTRRKKTDEAVRPYIPIEDPDPIHVRLTPSDAEQKLYDVALSDFETWYRAELDALGRQPVEIQGKTLKRLSAAVLVRLNMLRRISSCPFDFDAYTGHLSAKVEYIKTLVADRVIDGQKVLVSSCWKSLVRTLIDEIPGAVGFTGDMTIKKREPIMDAFRDDDNCRVLVVSTECCNEGVDLSCAQTAIIADFLWSPKKLQQMWNRILGVNQKDEAEVIYLINQGEIDEDMQRLISQKDSAINYAIDRIETESMPETLSPMQFANQMLQSRGAKWIEKGAK